MNLDLSQIDAAILSVVPKSNRKVAMVIVKAWDTLQQSGHVPVDRLMSDGDAALVADRIKALVQQGRLEGFGLLDRWRHSEVRLRDDQ